MTAMDAVGGSAATRRAVVTGASSGIGAATVRRLGRSGWSIVAGARRVDRLEALSAETGASAHPLDVTDDSSVAAFRDAVLAEGPVTTLVNNAGGAIGLDPVESAAVEDWRAMYEVNVLGTLRLTQAFLPAIRAAGGGDVLIVTSTAALAGYEGGGGYTGVKAAEKKIAETLRRELKGEPIRVIEVQPGAVETDFSLARFAGDAARAAKVYEGYTPLRADDIAEIIGFALERPRHVNLDDIVVRPVAQIDNFTTVRGE